VWDPYVQLWGCMRFEVGLVVPDLSKDQVNLISTGKAVLEDKGITIP